MADGSIGGLEKSGEKSGTGETAGGRSGSRGTRWIQIIKFDWTDLGRGCTSCACIRYIDSPRVFSAYFPLTVEGEEERKREGRKNVKRVGAQPVDPFIRYFPSARPRYPGRRFAGKLFTGNAAPYRAVARTRDDVSAALGIDRFHAFPGRTSDEHRVAEERRRTLSVSLQSSVRENWSGQPRPWTRKRLESVSWAAENRYGRQTRGFQITDRETNIDIGGSPLTVARRISRRLVPSAYADGSFLECNRKP